jgi:hypothetical protein
MFDHRVDALGFASLCVLYAGAEKWRSLILIVAFLCTTWDTANAQGYLEDTSYRGSKEEISYGFNIMISDPTNPSMWLAPLILSLHLYLHVQLTAC